MRVPVLAALPLLIAGCTRAPEAAVAPAEHGVRLYQQNCVPCHREDARGVPGIYPGLGGSPVVNGDALELARWVLNGERPVSMPAGRYSTQMLQFGWLKDADAAQLLSYVRGNFGNQSPPVDETTIVRARAGESR